jgi:hypothetical protein
MARSNAPTSSLQYIDNDDAKDYMGQLLIMSSATSNSHSLAGNLVASPTDDAFAEPDDAWIPSDSGAGKIGF